MGYPEEVPVLDVYAGDDVAFFQQIIIEDNGSPVDLVAEGWDDWEAMWRPSPASARKVALTVDTTDAASGVLRITATAAETRTMWEMRPGFDQTGVWDLQAVKDGKIRTWLRGETTHRGDATR